MSLDPLREEVARALRLLYERGLVSGASGNVSARVPGRDAMLITPSGVHKACVGPGDLVLVSFDGSVLEGGRPSIEWRMHRRAYLARGDVVAVVHAHPPFTLAAATAGLLTEVGSYPEARIVVGRIGVVPPMEPGSEELAEAVGRELESGANAVVLLRHGVVAVGSSPLEAEARVEALEEVARVVWLARALRFQDNNI